MNNNTERIDRYLQQEMEATEKAAFEKELSENSELRNELNDQQRIVDAARNAGLKTAFAQAMRKQVITKQAWQWGGLAFAVIAGFLIYALSTGLFKQHKKANHPEQNIPPAEIHHLDNNKDTVIETDDGVVFAIPAGAFKGGNNIELQIKTALTPYDIMRQGLSTVSNGSLLETGGMFYINGFRNGEPVDLVKDIAVSVPTANAKPNMQLFEGEEDNIGKVNWKNPKPIEKRLRTYDIATLNFYPPKYLPALKELDKPYRDKRYTDSLYYSFSGYPNTTRPAAAETPVIKKDTAKSSNTTDSNKPDTAGARIVLPNPNPPPGITQHNQDTSGYYWDSVIPWDIDPARIGAIWNSQFNKTILATREFEERLRFLHTVCEIGEDGGSNGHAYEYLNVYVHNLGKPLYENDLACARISRGAVRKQFEAFAARKDGSVLVAEGAQQQLTAYFEKQYRIYQDVAAKTWTAHQQEFERLNKIADEKKTTQQTEMIEKVMSNFQQELCFNLREAFKQTGINRPCNGTVPPSSPVRSSSNSYTVTVRRAGWCNIDQYVYDATTTRTSASFTDPASGKTVTLRYESVSVTIENRSQFDKVLVYLVPDSLNSFERMTDNGQVLTESLNMSLHYDAIALGYKGTDVYYFRQEQIQPGSQQFRLEKTTVDKLNLTLRTYTPTRINELSAEFDYQLYEQKEIARQLEWQQETELREIIIPFIFPCSSEPRPK